jgi:hypothetical protein
VWILEGSAHRLVASMNVSITLLAALSETN